MTKYLLLHHGPAARPPQPAARPGPEPAARPGPELAGELVDAQHLADPSLAVLIGDADGPVTGYWLVDVDSLDRAVQIAALCAGPVEVRELMRDGPGPDL